MHNNNNTLRSPGRYGHNIISLTAYTIDRLTTKLYNILYVVWCSNRRRFAVFLKADRIIFASDHGTSYKNWSISNPVRSRSPPVQPTTLGERTRYTRGYVQQVHLWGCVSGKEETARKPYKCSVFTYIYIYTQATTVVIILYRFTPCDYRTLGWRRRCNAHRCVQRTL